MRHQQLAYLALCGSSATSCTGFDATTAKWFKIDQAGLINGSVYGGTWAAGEMIAQNSSWTTTIPASVPSGFYLLRFETIALHSMPAVSACVEMVRDADETHEGCVAILSRVRTDPDHGRRNSPAYRCRACNVPWRIWKQR